MPKESIPIQPVENPILCSPLQGAGPTLALRHTHGYSKQDAQAASGELLVQD